MDSKVKVELRIEQKCIICQCGDITVKNQEKERMIYEYLIGNKVETIEINFCTPCCDKLNEIDEFRQICKNSLKSLEESINHAKNAPSPFHDDREPSPIDYEESKEDPNSSFQDEVEIQINKTKRHKNFYCSVCDNEFNCYPAKHIKMVHFKVMGSRKFKCKICKTIIEWTNNKAARHFEVHLEYKHPRKCPKCDKFFKSVRDYVTHEKNERYKTIDGGALECHHCSKKFSSRRCILRHLCLKHSFLHYCKECRKPFEDENEYEKHLVDDRTKMKVTKKKRVKIFVCDICGAVFKNNRFLLTTHVATKHFNQMVQCEICIKSFTSKYTKDQHIKEVHNAKEFFCETCGNGYPTQKQLQKHIKATHDGTPVTCEICGKKYGRGNINAHKQRHTDHRPFKCPNCPESFKSRGTLLRHSYSHNKTRPYNCLQCTAGYYMLKYLTNHYKQKHGLIYTPEETKSNCTIVKPQLLIDVKNDH